MVVFVNDILHMCVHRRPSVSMASGESLNWPAWNSEGRHFLSFGPSPEVAQHLKAERVALFQEHIPRWMEEFPYQEPDVQQPESQQPEKTEL